MLSTALTLLLSASPALKDGVYAGSITTRHGFVQLEVKGEKAHLLQVVTVHLPPAEIESADFSVKVSATQVCLSPAPRTIEPCLDRAGDKLLAHLPGGEKGVVTLERTAVDGG